MAQKFVGTSLVVGSGGILANVYKESGVTFAEIPYPQHLPGVLVVEGEMYVRLCGYRRIFHAALSAAQSVRFDRLTKKQRRHHLEVIASQPELLPGQKQKLKIIFYGRQDFGF